MANGARYRVLWQGKAVAAGSSPECTDGNVVWQHRMCMDVQRWLLGMVVLFAVKWGPRQFNTLCIRACNCSCGWVGEGDTKMDALRGWMQSCVGDTGHKSYRADTSHHHVLQIPTPAIPLSLTRALSCLHLFISFWFSLPPILKYLCKPLAGKGNQNILPDAAVTGIESVMDTRLQPSNFSASVKGLVG